jgi:hypothetical protein
MVLLLTATGQLLLHEKHMLLSLQLTKAFESQAAVQRSWVVHMTWHLHHCC